MKICFVSKRLHGISGGVERALRDISCALAGRGHEVHVLLPDPPGAEPFYPFSPEVRLVSRVEAKTPGQALRRKLSHILQRTGMIRKKTFGALVWKWTQVPMQREIESWLEAERPDVAIAFGPVPMALLGTSRLPSDIVRIGSIHTRPTMEFTPRSSDPAPYQTAQAIRSLSLFDRIVVLLPEFLEWFDPALQPKVRVIPNGVPAPTKPSGSRKRETRIISVGRLVREKRHDLLLDAWARVAGSFPDWHLDIYGEGYLRNKLQDRIAALGLTGRVSLRGAVKDIDDAYGSASLMVHPAEQEGFGLVVAEAFAHALPVVGFADCTGVNTLVQDRVNGRLVPARENRAGALAEILMEILSNPEELAHIGASGPETIRAFAPERITDMWENLLRELCRGRSNTQGVSDHCKAR